MNTRIGRQMLAATSLSLAVCSTLALGQDNQDRDRQPTAAQRERQDDKNVHLIKASDLIGMNVENNAGDSLGEIHDLAINRTTGGVRYAIVSSGGVLNVGDRLVAVPLRALKFTGHDKPAKLDVTTERLKDAPEFKSDGWNTIGDEKWGGVVYQFYGLDAKFDDDIADRTDMGDKDSPQAAERNQFLKGSDVVGMNVENRENKDLGEVQDLMIDINSGRCAYAVLANGGTVGVNERLFAIPWRSLNYDRNENTFVLNVAEDKLKNAPGFDAKRWPTVADLRWSRNDREFSGNESDWIYGFDEEDNPKAGNADQDTPRDRDRDEYRAETAGWALNEPYGQKFDTRSVETIRGKVTGVDTMTPISGMAKGVSINVQTDTNQTHTVHLGPEWFLKRQQATFDNGDQVTVIGSRITIDGKNAIMACEVRREGRIMMLRNRDNGQPTWDVWHYANGDRDRNN